MASPSSLVRPLAAMLAVLVAVAAVTAYAIRTTRQLAGSGGLITRYWLGPDTAAPPDVLEVSAPGIEAVRTQAMRFGGRPLTAEWSGFFIVPSSQRYRLSVYANHLATLEVDGRPAASSEMAAGGPAVDLARGQHRLRLLYSEKGGGHNLALLWAREAGSFTAVPPVLLIPELRYPGEVGTRRLIWRVNQALPWIWLGCLCLGIGSMVIRFGRDRSASRLGVPRLPLSFWSAAVGVLVLFVAAIWWGAPDQAWAPDELTPTDVLAAMESRFGRGWTSIYPPLHYAVLALCYLPFHAAAGLGLTDLGDGARFQLALASRIVSVGMALGIVWLTGSIAREHHGPRAARFAAATIAVALPLTYYAKTANLDVPYVFWLTLALKFYLRAIGGGRPRDYYLFVLTGVASVCTKDQAYGFFVLPALAIIVGSLWYRRRGQLPTTFPALPVLARMSLMTIVAAAVGYNMVFNWVGFTEHVRLIIGPGRVGFRMYPRDVAGFLSMTGAAFAQMGQLMGWPLFALTIRAAVAAVRSSPIFSGWLLLPAVSYYLCFITVVMYHYDRFFLGMAVVAALIAGPWLDSWTRPGMPWRVVRLAVVWLAIGYSLSRCIALDLMMAGDSRYAVERTLAAAVRPGEVVGGLGHYLPRASAIRWTILPRESSVEAVQPRYLMLNVGYFLRGDPGSRSRSTYSAMATGAAGYDLFYRSERQPVFPLSLERRFRQAEEDPMSSMTKISPLVEVYLRRAQPVSR